MPGLTELHRASCPYPLCPWERTTMSAELADRLRSDHAKVCVHRSLTMPRIPLQRTQPPEEQGRPSSEG